MDFEFTSRSNIKPAWATSSDDAKTSNHHIFGTNQDSPFLFSTPAPQTPHAHPWAPPPSFSPEKAFPQPQLPDIRDIDMSESSPFNPELRFVYQSPKRSHMNPVGATSSDDAGTHNHNMFGENQGSPFLFNTPPSQASRAHPWEPPPHFSPKKVSSSGESSRLRSREAPMDFEFTSRSNIKPAWATPSDDAKTSNHHIFGTNQDLPFLFSTPAPQTPHAHPWAPPPFFSPEKAFPQSLFSELREVDMSESSPPNPELRHVYQSRQTIGETSSDDAGALNHNMFGATPQTVHVHFWAPPHPSSRDAARSQPNPEGGDGAVAPGASLISRFMRRCFGTE